MPTYVNVNLGAEEKSIRIWNLCMESKKGTCKQVHDWLFVASMIRGVRYRQLIIFVFWNTRVFI